MTDIKLPESLVDIRQRIDALGLASLAYAGVGITNDTLYIAVIAGDDTILIKRKFRTQEPATEIVQMLGSLASNNNIKIISAAILGNREYRKLGERLWLEEDIAPLFLESREVTEETVKEAALQTSATFNEHGLITVNTDEQGCVDVAALTTKEAYIDGIDKDSWSAVVSLAKKFSKHETSLVFINATAQGGGVALMRHALVRFLRELDVPVRWHVMRPNSDVFEITKRKFHNVLQAVTTDDVVLTERDKDIYSAWIQENVASLRPVFESARIIVIDDPQPAGLIPHIKEINPQARIIYRSHIHLDRDLLSKEGSPQQATWSFLWESIGLADVFVSHPVLKFIPYEAQEKAVTMPATTDLLDGLNKPLSDTQMAYYRKLFNKILLEHDQEPLNDERPYYIQIARFDPSKGIPDVIEAYRLLREKLADNVAIPQLVLVGHGSVDDPDGVPVYNMILHLLQEDAYRSLARDVKVIRLHHNDQILNALLRGSHGALQLSHKEGFEVKVTEAIEKGKPVVAYKAGGIPLQIEEGKNGFLVERGQVQTVADKLYEILSDEAMYTEMSAYAARCANPNYFTVFNAAKWLYLADELLSGKNVPGDGVSVGELMKLPAGIC